VLWNKDVDTAIS